MLCYKNQLLACPTMTSVQASLCIGRFIIKGNMSCEAYLVFDPNSKKVGMAREGARSFTQLSE
jgi:hypothetical protein